MNSFSMVVLFLITRLVRWTTVCTCTRKEYFSAQGAISYYKSNSASKTIQYQIRLATQEDITSMHFCNLKNLPENYSFHFYNNQLSQWPQLSIIAEDENKELIGYALGRTEIIDPDVAIQQTGKHTVQGHIASIAIHEQFRGCGVAKGMMRFLHKQFVDVYAIDDASLYCRVSNIAAKNLYSEVFNYKIQSIVPNYYEDGENACYMKVTGLSVDAAIRSRSKSQFSTELNFFSAHK